MKLNLNADLGEFVGESTTSADEALLPIVDSANIACGFHAGDPQVMRNTVRLALAGGTSLGAHPAYPDLKGFGRRAMTLRPAELEAIILYQLGALSAMAQAEGGSLTHVKPHGALNNQACEDAVLADTVARAIVAFNRNLILLAPATSELVAAGERGGLRVACEIFADRTYTARGTLQARGTAGAVLHDPVESLAHVRRMLDAGGVVATDGTVLKTNIHSICVHGDNAAAVAMVRILRAALIADGHQLVPLPEHFAPA